MGKSIRKKQQQEKEQDQKFIESLRDKNRIIDYTSKEKKKIKRSLLNLPDFMLNNYLMINHIEDYKPRTHSIEKRAKDAIKFLYEKFPIRTWFLDIFYNIQCIYEIHKTNPKSRCIKSIDYNLRFFWGFNNQNWCWFINQKHIAKISFKKRDSNIQ